MKRRLRSATTMEGEQRAGARALWRAAGVREEDFGKPLVAIANSFTEFVPGHVHLRDVGTLVADAISASGGIAREFHTIAVDDGIAMGHDGMLYSLPSRDLIADSIEYMVNAHCADALVCISNCDKITPGMLMAAMRLDLPTVFVSGGPMEAGRVVIDGEPHALHAIDAMVAGASPSLDDKTKLAIERAACPTCGSCSGMFTANSMNCLVEALGLGLPGNGTLLATHADREAMFRLAGETVMTLALRHYEDGEHGLTARQIAGRAAFMNAMAMDIAMGGSTNTILHLLAAAREGQIDFNLADIDRLSRNVPHLCKVAPAPAGCYLEDVHRAGGIPGILGELDRAGLLDTTVPTVHAASLAHVLEDWDIVRTSAKSATRLFTAAPGGERTIEPFSQDQRYEQLDLDRVHGAIRSAGHAHNVDGGLAVLFGNLAPHGAVIKTAALTESQMQFRGPARVFESEQATVAAILQRKIKPGDVVIVRYEGPRGGPGMQEMLHPTTFLRSMGLAEHCAIITDGRFSGGSSGLSVGHVSPEAAAGGNIGLIEDGDTITIDIAARRVDIAVSDKTLEDRRAAMEVRGSAWKPAAKRPRQVSAALRAYALLASSAAEGAVRQLDAS